MMFKETFKGVKGIGINKGVLVGILFMIIVLGILVGVKMVRGAGGGCTPGQLCYFMEEGIIREYTSSDYLASGQPVTGENIAQATNRKEVWDRISKDNEFKDAREDYLKKYYKTNELDAEQLTLKSEYKDLIKNLENPHLWDEIKKDDKLSREVLTEMGYKPADGLKGFSNSKWVSGSAGPELQFTTSSKGITNTVRFSEEAMKNGFSLTPSGNGVMPSDTEFAGARALGSSNPAGSGAGGNGGSPGGGQEGKKLDEAFQKASALLGTISSLGIKADMFKLQATAPGQYVPGEVTVPEGKTAVVGDDEGKSVVLTGQIGGSKYSWGTQGLGMMTSRNGNLICFANGLAVGGPITTPASENTLVELNTDRVNTVTPAVQTSVISTNNALAKFIFPLVTASDIVGENRAHDLGSQYISLVGDDVKIGGLSIGINMLKPFDKISAKGSELSVVDGDVIINFKNMKTYYPRQIDKNDFFINEIRNDYDTKNVFMLVPNGAKGNYFEDGKFRLTVGDAVVKNPLKGYENLSIPKTRLAMWKKAAQRDIID